MGNHDFAASANDLAVFAPVFDRERHTGQSRLFPEVSKGLIMGHVYLPVLNNEEILTRAIRYVKYINRSSVICFSYE